MARQTNRKNPQQFTVYVSVKLVPNFEMTEGEVKREVNKLLKQLPKTVGEATATESIEHKH